MTKLTLTFEDVLGDNYLKEMFIEPFKYEVRRYPVDDFGDKSEDEMKVVALFEYYYDAYEYCVEMNKYFNLMDTSECDGFEKFVYEWGVHYDD